MRTYPVKEWQWPSVTTIESDCNPKNWGPQWGANMVVEWIRQNSKSNAWHSPENVFYTISEAELNEARFNFRNVSQDALDIGSAVHKAIEYYLETGREPASLQAKGCPDKVVAGFVAFLEWQESVKLKVVALEETVYGNYWAGTLDLRCWLNDKLYIVDFKTSKDIYPDSMGPQIAAYRSTFGDKVEGSGILRLDKETGEPEWKDFSKRYERDLRTFNIMVELFFSRHPIISKKAGYEANKQINDS